MLVQAAQTTAETDFMLGLAEEHDFIAGVVGWVDLADDASVAVIERWATTSPKLKSLRPMLQDLPDDDWIRTAPRRAVLDAMKRTGLRFDALVMPRHLEALLSFVRANPSLPVVIDHAAKPCLAQGWNGEWPERWRRGMAELAREPQVVCKLSGLLTEASPEQCRDPVATLRPVWDTLLETFGPKRLMWGSDWPVLTLVAGYADWVNASEVLIGELSRSEQVCVWGDCAAKVYGV